MEYRDFPKGSPDFGMCPEDQFGAIVLTAASAHKLSIEQIQEQAYVVVLSSTDPHICKVADQHLMLFAAG